jgi:hypothetical protein
MIALLAAMAMTTSSAKAKEAAVIPTIADSPSQILRAGQIFSFRIVSAAKSNAPVPGMPGGPYSAYEVSAVILAAYKGTLLEKEGQPFQATPWVYQGPIRSRPAGLWVGLAEDDGPRAGEVDVAFCRKDTGAEVSASSLMSGMGEGCQLLPESSAADVELVIRLESTHAGVAQAIKALEQAKARECYYYLEYLFARYDRQLRQLQDWKPLLDLLSDPALPRNLRYLLVDDLDGMFGSLQGLSAGLRDAYLLALIRAALAYPLADDQANLFANQIKNWVQGDLFKPRPHATEVFRSAPEDRTRALQAIRKLPPSEDLKVVERWLSPA